MSKNWDNPLKSFQMLIGNLNKHHGTDYERIQWKELVGYTDNLGSNDFHEHYLTYCKLMNSPLGQALR